MSPSSKRRGSTPPPSPGSRAGSAGRAGRKGSPEPAPPAGPPGPPSEPPPQPASPRSDDTLYTVTGGRFDRLGVWAGVIYAFMAFLGSSLLPIGRVEPRDTSAAIARQLVDDRGRVSAGVLLTMVSLFFLLVFVAWLHRWLREAEGERGWLATVALGGGLLMVATMSVVVVLSIASTVLEGYGPDAVLARTLLVLQWRAVAIAFVPTAGFLGGTSLVGLSTGALPQWLSYSGLAIAVALLIPPVAFFPFVLSNLWIGMLAILLLQQERLNRT